MRFTKGAMESSFRRALCTKANIRKKSIKIQCVSTFFQAEAKCFSNTFPKEVHSSALSKKKWTAPFLEHLVLSLVSTEIRQKCKFKQIAESTSKISH